MYLKELDIGIKIENRKIQTVGFGYLNIKKYTKHINLHYVKL